MSLYKKNVRRNSQYSRKTINKAHALAPKKYALLKEYEFIPSAGEENLLSSSDEDIDESSNDSTLRRPGSRSACAFQYKSHRDLESICIDSNRVWISCWNDNEACLVGKTGDIKKKVSLDTVICDISYSGITRNVWMCCRDKTIRELEYNSAKVIFNTSLIPLSLCISSAGSVVVGMENQLIEYDINGKIMQKVQSRQTKRTKKPTVVYPNKIKQCPRSKDFAVVDRCFSAMGGNDKAHVIVFDCNLQIRFRYHGCLFTTEVPRIKIRAGSDLAEIDGSEDNFQNQKNEDNDVSKQIDLKSALANEESSSRFAFNPRDICFNSEGKLLVADYDNKAIYLVNSNGNHIRTVYTCDACPCVIDVHSDGRLWIGDKRKKIILTELENID